MIGTYTIRPPISVYDYTDQNAGRFDTNPVVVDDLRDNWPTPVVDWLKQNRIHRVKYFRHGKHAVLFKIETDHPQLQPMLRITSQDAQSGYRAPHPCILPAMKSEVVGAYSLSIVPRINFGTDLPARISAARNLAQTIIQTSQLSDRCPLVIDDLDRTSMPQARQTGWSAVHPMVPFISDWGCVTQRFLPPDDQQKLYRQWQQDPVLAPWRRAAEIIAPNWDDIGKVSMARNVTQFPSKPALHLHLFGSQRCPAYMR